MFDYTLRVLGPRGEPLAMMELDCDGDDEAIRIAALAKSPFGHDLWKDGAFMGWFEAAGAETESPEPDVAMELGDGR